MCGKTKPKLKTKSLVRLDSNTPPKESKSREDPGEEEKTRGEREREDGANGSLTRGTVIVAPYNR